MVGSDEFFVFSFVDGVAVWLSGGEVEDVAFVVRNDCAAFGLVESEFHEGQNQTFLNWATVSMRSTCPRNIARQQ